MRAQSNLGGCQRGVVEDDDDTWCIILERGSWLTVVWLNVIWSLDVVQYTVVEAVLS